MSLYDSRPGLEPKLNAFELSHNHYFTADFGWLYPAGWQECIPGDVHQLDLQCIVRCLPLVKPILNNMNCRVDFFFVPYRILWKEFEDFYTTIDQDSIPPKEYTGTPPVWGQHDDGTFDAVPLDVSKLSIWNHIGLNTQLGDLLDATGTKTVANLETFVDFLPTDFVRRAYYCIWNNWYRDQNFQEPIDFRSDSSQTLLRRAWSKDYFTASLYSRQKGTAPSIPLTGTANVVFNGTGYIPTEAGISPIQNAQLTGNYQPTLGFNFNQNPNTFFTGAQLTGGANFTAPLTVYANLNGDEGAGFKEYLNNNSIDLTNLGTFTISDLRELAGIQRQMEALMIFGSRFVEVLKGIHGVSPTDARLSIPERLGGFDFSIRIDEVIQNSSSVSDSPLGNQAGRASGVTQSNGFTYKVEEPGIILTLCSFQPSQIYRNRFPRELFRKTRLEQVSPFFVNFSFQAILNREIFGQLKEIDNEVWAYQGMYDECRERQDYVSGQFLDNMSAWVSTRYFDSLPAMNADFIQCDPDDDVFAVVDEDKFLCRFYFNLKSLRQLPEYSVPGLTDHVYGGL